jgi:hypothetical protein
MQMSANGAKIVTLAYELARQEARMANDKFSGTTTTVGDQDEDI